jgi:alpha-galactosidase
MSRLTIKGVLTLGMGLVGFATAFFSAPQCRAQQLANSSLVVTVQAKDGSFQLATPTAKNRPVLSAVPGAEIDGKWLRSSDFPQHRGAASPFYDSLGAGRQISVTCTGLQGKPDLIYTVQLYDQRPYATVQVEVQNHTGSAVTVQAIRSVEAIGQPVIGIDGPESSDRVLSDSYSEDWPRLVIYDLASGPRQMHRGAWSQVIYNRDSKQSLFVGALSADRFLTLLHLMYQGTGDDAKITSYTVDSTGTTELQKENALRQDPPEDAIDLSLPLNDGESVSSERVMMATGTDYHSQLLAYGDAIRRLHDARVTAPNLLGWWSWTPYHMAINEGAALTNAQWMAENLKSFGYKYFFIDEGYQYARGEYETANARLFPDGMQSLGDEVRHLGLTFGVWTAPFEVSNRAWVYENHKDWLVHTADGTPIPIVLSTQGDTIYALDTTNPGAQEYLRQTYTTLTQEWGVRLLKFDFMDTASIEGYRYRPNTTALEAQLIGLRLIRKVVGEDVLIDKDGSAMLPPVGIVDAGRISADTAHSFMNTKVDEPGIAARFYMNRNYFLADPDAFNIASDLPVAPGRQGYGGGGFGGPGGASGAAGGAPAGAAAPGAAGPAAQSSGAVAAAGGSGGGQGAAQGRQPRPGAGGGQFQQGGQTLSEAQAAITLAAVSGGMFEIGDDLPILGSESDRLDLVKNQDLLDMAKISRAATPVDLLSYDPEDGQPSIFFLREGPRQSILAVFNWTDQPRSHTLKLTDLGLAGDHTYQGSDVLNEGEAAGLNGGTIELDNVPKHSVRVIKLIDSGVQAAAPTITAQVPQQAVVSEIVHFAADAQETGVPALAYHWDFGDGTTADGEQATHAYTRDANFAVQLTVEGLDGVSAHNSFTVQITGAQTPGSIQQNTRYKEGGSK